MRARLLRLAGRPAVAAAALLALLATAPAQAGYDVCNRTGFEVDVAMVYLDQGQWVSVGWYSIRGGNCEQILTSALNNQYYYLFAEQVNGPTIWDGEYYFCASDNAFEIVGDHDCRRRGYYELGFFEVDVRNSKYWTTDLVD